MNSMEVPSWEIPRTIAGGRLTMPHLKGKKGPVVPWNAPGCVLQLGIGYLRFRGPDVLVYCSINHLIVGYY